MAQPFIGQIQPYGFNFAPRNWAFCNGQLLPIAQNTALFSLLGTIYGGDGRTTFALPDLRGRAAFNTGTGPGLSPRPIGEKSGQESVILNVQQLPPHHHGVAPAAASIDGDLATPQNNYPASQANAYFAASNASMGSFNSADTGGNGSHNNMQPYLVVNWCIALQGTYPTRS